MNHSWAFGFRVNLRNLWETMLLILCILCPYVVSPHLRVNLMDRNRHPLSKPHILDDPEARLLIDAFDDDLLPMY